VSARSIARVALLSRPVGAVATLLGLALVLELTPGLARFRLFGKRPATAGVASTAAAPVTSVGEARLETETRDVVAPVARAPRARGPIAAESAEDPALPGKDQPPVPLLDPSGHALDAFFSKLERVERREPGAIARIVHFGDSLIASDFVSGTLRRVLQKRFGDAGHGFTLIANAWPSYFHWDVKRYATAGFKVSRIVGPYAEDGFYGLGGVSFRAERHALARFGTDDGDGIGSKVSRFVVAYAEEPTGGRFQLRLDGKDVEVVDTRGPVLRARFHELRAPDGRHELELQTLAGESRLFGVVLEREGPGVVLDAIGIQGARIRFLAKQNEGHFTEQLRFRRPELLVYQFGANESGDGFVYSMEDYRRTMREVIEHAKRALPEASCLVIATMDRAAKQGDEVVSVRVIPSLVAEQKRVAAEVGCAFFDTYTAMGGKGSMPIWVRRGLGQADLTHPSGAGAERIGNWIYGATMRAYASYQRTRAAP
jgi:lysophospholipase L1-like esterase